MSVGQGRAKRAEPRPASRSGTHATPGQGTPVLLVDDLSKTYADGTRALDGIGLSVQQGEIVALIGARAAGRRRSSA